MIAKSILILILACLVGPSKACSCLGPIAVDSSLERSDSALVARISGPAIVPDPTIPNGNQFVFYPVRLQRIFKGCDINPYRPLFVSTGGNEALCGVNLETYRYYALFGSVTMETIPGYPQPQQVLNIGICDANTVWRFVQLGDRQLLRQQQRQCW